MIHLKSIAIPREKSHCNFHGKFNLHYKILPCCLFSKPCWNILWVNLTKKIQVGENFCNCNSILCKGTFEISVKSMHSTARTVWKNGKFSLTEIFSSNQLFGKFFSKTIAFTKFLLKKSEREFLQFPHCAVWNDKKFTLTEKIFREINSLVLL